MNNNHHSIWPTCLVCINYVWFTFNTQQVLLPSSCTESSRVNLTDTDSHARNINIRKQCRYISFVFHPFPLKLCRNVEKSLYAVF